MSLHVRIQNINIVFIYFLNIRKVEKSINRENFAIIHSFQNLEQIIWWGNLKIISSIHLHDNVFFSVRALETMTSSTV